MNTIYLGLGSNLGNRKENILQAIDEMKNIGVRVEKVSSLLETEPVGGPVQGNFINAVLKGGTELSPLNLLRELQLIEKKLGRTKGEVNGPRVIDVDILLYGNEEVKTSELTIPHPRMLTRKFVLIPLGEIEPQLAKDLVNANH